MSLPIILAADSIVVYRSSFEQDWDQFIYNNPEIILGLIGFLILAAIAVKVTDKIYRRRK